MIGCRLRIPWIYDPLRDEIRCGCGAVAITRAEADFAQRWRAFFPRAERARGFDQGADELAAVLAQERPQR